ncbi:hypothetical protein GRAN_5195 [Granulicella sibirica]|uniref:Uncharacterized protein n=1 Tax=Granulicella sibirica TaxID=2479048 RepID=A0A4Q0ST75_9BACT|nr:hypothetical protein GRAN_5195 [Granulicella sibirica]
MLHIAADQGKFTLAYFLPGPLSPKILIHLHLTFKNVKAFRISMCMEVNIPAPFDSTPQERKGARTREFW